MENHDSGKNEEKDPRIAVMGSILGSSIAMLGICIPLVAITKMFFLPAFVITGAFLATAFVWFSGKKKPLEDHSSQQIVELEKTITDLTERLENVETINHYERAMAEKSLANLNEETSSEATTVMGPNSREAE